MTFNNLFSALFFLKKIIKITNESSRRQPHKRGRAQKHSFTKSPHALRNAAISFSHSDGQILSDNDRAARVFFFKNMSAEDCDVGRWEPAPEQSVPRECLPWPAVLAGLSTVLWGNPPGAGSLVESTFPCLSAA